jgi:hypothetical protein
MLCSAEGTSAADDTARHSPPSDGGSIGTDSDPDHDFGDVDDDTLVSYEISVLNLRAQVV